IGVAALGAVLQHRVGAQLAAAGIHENGLAAAVSSSGLRAAHGRAAIVHAANVAFVSGFQLILLIACVTVFLGALASLALIRGRVAQPEEVRPASPGMTTSSG